MQPLKEGSVEGMGIEAMGVEGGVVGEEEGRVDLAD